MQIDTADLNQNTTSSISSLSEARVDAEVQSISETSQCRKELKSNINQVHLSRWEITDILLGLAGFVALLYLLAAIAFGLALLYYTFKPLG